MTSLDCDQGSDFSYNKTMSVIFENLAPKLHRKN